MEGREIDRFISEYKPGLSEYCSTVIDENGLVYECRDGHIKTLIDMTGDREVLTEVPEGESMLFFLADKMHCVLVDYENQIFSGELTKSQRRALDKLALAGLIKMNAVDIKKKC